VPSVTALLCPHCNHQVTAGDVSPGQTFRCDACSRYLVAPESIDHHGPKVQDTDGLSQAPPPPPLEPKTRAVARRKRRRTVRSQRLPLVVAATVVAILVVASLTMSMWNAYRHDETTRAPAQSTSESYGVAGGPRFRKPTAAEMDVAQEALRKYVADSGYELVDAVASRDGDRSSLVFLKVRCLNALGGYQLESWRIGITEGKAWTVIEWPFPDRQTIEAGEALMDSLTDWAEGSR